MTQEQTRSEAAARRARAVVEAGGVTEALGARTLGAREDLTLSEALVLGLLRQGVRTFVSVLGHGSTEVGEVLRIYQAAGALGTFGVRSEIEASHAASALRWVTGEKAAVVTSIGPGALQALAAALVPASDCLGVYYLFGDETTEDEGPNMQQVPKAEQHLFLRMAAALGEAYALHTPAALPTALRRGSLVVDHPHRPGPFFLLLPMNTQGELLRAFPLEELPDGRLPPLPAAADQGAYDEAVAALGAARRVVVKVGGGARQAGGEILELLELCGGVAVTSPLASGTIPFGHERNMLVGGSKGTLPGNFAMEEADLLVALGSRFVCQSDCSRTGYPKVRRVININADPRSALHYGRTIALWGEVAATLRTLSERLGAAGRRGHCAEEWLTLCAAKRREWGELCRARYDHPTLVDPVWGRAVLTQPAAIKIVTDWAREKDAVTFFDAGDVQANGFQIVEDDRPGRTYTETGASYMGFAASALLASGFARRPFYGVALTGDGSFTMSPQILIDGAAHGARGALVLLDNRRMAAISGLQQAQYGVDFATWDHLSVDYVAWANAVEGVLGLQGGHDPESLRGALERARAHPGLSLIHVPVYYGPDPLGGMGVYGRWNVGPWVEATQRLRHDIAL
ncbi:MAG: thiamine pyrophosphate-dependent enzyme [Polyangia bacterium]|jgi:3D-(3,5/4)-trihydroxycyclohexane-1,2-dione acylhydrolase (decyclizing)|nr:thiamine pyrophosphate-dependent enzyme [Polyangia bacterium]